MQLYVHLPWLQSFPLLLGYPWVQYVLLLQVLPLVHVHQEDPTHSKLRYVQYMHTSWMNM